MSKAVYVIGDPGSPGPAARRLAVEEAVHLEMADTLRIASRVKR
ncbi:hypothetical protein [Streptomyces fractus]